MTIRTTWRLGVLPLLLYAAAYVTLTFPLILEFKTAFFCNDTDGYQGIWDIWSVQQAVLHGRGTVFFTPLLHWPLGASLWLHSLASFDGLLSLPLCGFLSPQIVFNLLIIFAFAGSGLTAFWLAWDQTHRWWPSLAAGYAFTFSSLHFAHATGHLHQTTAECFPLYVLLMIRHVRQPSAWRALAAALAGLTVLLCDPYQFFYAAIITGIWLGFEWIGPFSPAAMKRQVWTAGTLAFFTALTCGPLLYFMLREAAKPLTREHDPEMLSADLLSLFVPGWTWQFHDLTRSIWEDIGKYQEKSVSVGLAVFVAALFARSAAASASTAVDDKTWSGNRADTPSFVGRWWTIAAVFAVVALGPTLRINNHPVTTHMPYRLLDFSSVFRISGVPARMMLGAQLAISTLAAVGLKRLGSMQLVLKSRWRSIAVVIFTLALVVESEPHLQSSVPAQAPRWVTALRDLPINGAVLELRTNEAPIQLYYQTIHRRPMALGYLARVPQATVDFDQQILDRFAARDFDWLRQAGFAAIVNGAAASKLELPLMYEDREVRIYALTR